MGRKEGILRQLPSNYCFPGIEPGTVSWECQALPTTLPVRVTRCIQPARRWTQSICARCLQSRQTV